MKQKGFNLNNKAVEEIEIKDSSCSGFDETELLKKLGIK